MVKDRSKTTTDNPTADIADSDPLL
jgi:hypothetical protein